jgi:hypothetical protein
VSPLQTMRVVFAAFVASVAVLGVVVVVLAAAGGVSGSLSVVVAVVVVAAVGLVTPPVARTATPDPDCSTVASLRRTYSSRFFLRLALADAPAVAGLVGFLLSGVPFVYAVGLGFTVLELGRLAPTRRRLEDEEAELARRGCLHPLLQALTAPPPGEVPRPE